MTELPENPEPREGVEEWTADDLGPEKADGFELEDELLAAVDLADPPTDRQSETESPPLPSEETSGQQPLAASESEAPDIIDEIADLVCQVYGIEREQLVDKAHPQLYGTPRKMFVRLAREETGTSFARIAKFIDRTGQTLEAADFTFRQRMTYRQRTELAQLSRMLSGEQSVSALRPPDEQPEEQEPSTEISRIVDVVCSAYGIDRETMRGPRRTKDLQYARQMVVALSRHQAKQPRDASFAKIGAELNRTGHTLNGPHAAFLESLAEGQPHQDFISLQHILDGDGPLTPLKLPGELVPARETRADRRSRAVDSTEWAISVVADAYGLDPEDLVSRSSAKHLVFARGMAAELARTAPDVTLSVIAERLGRTSGGVSLAAKRFAEQMTDQERAEFAELRRMFDGELPAVVLRRLTAPEKPARPIAQVRRPAKRPLPERKVSRREFPREDFERLFLTAANYFGIGVDEVSRADARNEQAVVARAVAIVALVDHLHVPRTEITRATKRSTGSIYTTYRNKGQSLTLEQRRAVRHIADAFEHGDTLSERVVETVSALPKPKKKTGRERRTVPKAEAILFADIRARRSTAVLAIERDYLDRAERQISKAFQKTGSIAPEDLSRETLHLAARNFTPEVHPNFESWLDKVCDREAARFLRTEREKEIVADADPDELFQAVELIRAKLGRRGMAQSSNRGATVEVSRILTGKARAIMDSRLNGDKISGQARLLSDFLGQIDRIVKLKTIVGNYEKDLTGNGVRIAQLELVKHAELYRLSDQKLDRFLTLVFNQAFEAHQASLVKSQKKSAPVEI